MQINPEECEVKIADANEGKSLEVHSIITDHLLCSVSLEKGKYVQKVVISNNNYNEGQKMYTYKAKLMRVVDGDTVDAETQPWIWRIYETTYTFIWD